MPDDVHIKQFELSEQQELLSFLSIAYPDDLRRSDAAFWRWQFLENPYTAPDNLPLWIARSGNTIVGQVASIPVELKLGGENRPALWIVDYILLREYRTGGFGVKLLQASDAYCKTTLTLGYNQKAAVVMSRLRWRPLGNIDRYQILLFPGNTPEISRLGPARHFANVVYAPVRWGIAQRSQTGSGELREVTQFDSSFDDLCQEASGQWPCAVRRTSRLLEWQFMKQPGKTYEVLGYYENERLQGYVVLYFRKGKTGEASPKAAISDLCYAPGNPQLVIDTLLQAALLLALEKRAGSLVMDVCDERVEKGLQRFGFRRMKAGPLFAVKTVEREDLVYEKSNWFLTRGDSDVSIFEDSNA